MVLTHGTSEWIAAMVVEEYQIQTD